VLVLGRRPAFIGSSPRSPRSQSLRSPSTDANSPCRRHVDDRPPWWRCCRAGLDVVEKRALMQRVYLNDTPHTVEEELELALASPGNPFLLGAVDDTGPVRLSRARALRCASRAHRDCPGGWALALRTRSDFSMDALIIIVCWPVLGSVFRVARSRSRDRPRLLDQFGSGATNLRGCSDRALKC